MQLQEDHVLVITITKDEKEAEIIIKNIMEKKLAACVNAIPGMKSFYWWKDEIKRDFETIILIKTTKSALPELKQEILENHSYEIPELMVIPIIDGSQRYLDWIDHVVKSPNK